jgi:hypothetical protein
MKSALPDRHAIPTSLSCALRNPPALGPLATEGTFHREATEVCVRSMSRLHFFVRCIVQPLVLLLCLVHCGSGKDGTGAAPIVSLIALPDVPSDEQLLRVGLFVQPLVPSRSTTPDDNRAVAVALRAYSVARYTAPDSVGALADFVANRPESPWTPILLVDLGFVYRKTGHFSKALETWQTAWAMSKDLSDTKGRAIGDAAIAYLSQLEAYFRPQGAARAAASGS